MLKAVTTETMKMRDNNGKRYYIHIQYDGHGNPLRRQVSRVAKLAICQLGINLLT